MWLKQSLSTSVSSNNKTDPQRYKWNIVKSGIKYRIIHNLFVWGLGTGSKACSVFLTCSRPNTNKFIYSVYHVALNSSKMKKNCQKFDRKQSHVKNLKNPITWHHKWNLKVSYCDVIVKNYIQLVTVYKAKIYSQCILVAQ
jgi:hypothetical protein